MHYALCTNTPHKHKKAFFGKMIASSPSLIYNP